MPHSEALFKRIREIFDARIPFNRVLGLNIDHLDFKGARLRFEMRDVLVGNYMRQTLHGGVISSVLDATGGLTAFLGALSHNLSDDPESSIQRFGRLGTIDLRVDYLRPGRGKWFEASGFVLRTGRRVAVARMELINDRSSLVAVGTGTYIIS